MSTIAVLGAGGGGLSATVELTQAGHDVRLWNRNKATIAPYMASGRVGFAGVMGTGHVEPSVLTTDLGVALDGADAIVVCLPSVAHGGLFADLAAVGAALPIVLNPGHTGGALHARAVFGRHGCVLPPLAEFSTLTYVARVLPDGVVRTTGRANTVRAASLPGGDEALHWGLRLFPGAEPVSDVLASSLANVNLILHPPGAILALAWVEATGGDFTFYVDGMTPGVARVMSSLDEERRSVAKAFGHELPALLQEMVKIGTVDAPAAVEGDLRAAIRAGTANQSIKAPESTQHRYYREDLPFGVLPFIALADVAGEPVPTARALLTVGALAIGDTDMSGLDSHTLGLDGCGLEDLLRIVRH